MEKILRVYDEIGVAGNRTQISWLGTKCSTIELIPL